MPKKQNKWLLPSNTENLKIIIAQGLITTEDGFKKYYKDTLGLIEGYIPLFKNHIDQEILSYVVSEEKGLTPTLIEIDVKNLTGKVKTVENNTLVDICLSKIQDLDIIFLPIAIPLSLIRRIIFQSNDDKNNFKEETKLYSNVILCDLKLSSTLAEQKIFKQTIFSSQSIEGLKNIQIQQKYTLDYQKVYAYGGMLSNLFYFAKNGKLSHDMFTLFCDLNIKNINHQDIEIYNYFSIPHKQSDTIKTQMDYGLIKVAIHSENFKEEVLDFLLSDIWENNSKKRTKELADILITFESNREHSVSEQFEEAKTALERTLLMLFLGILHQPQDTSSNKIKI
jgi:hypothetical protein